MGVASVKVWIEPDERYPDYLLTEQPTGSYEGVKREVEVPERLVARWKVVKAEYERVQNEMGNYYKGDV
jgi:hypothetical protein